MSDASPGVPPAGAAGPIERIQCQWCQGQNEKTATTCRTCGAPLDVRNLVTESGWREAPRLKDMTEIHFGQSICQVEGEIVPVAEMHLSQGDAVYFEHHVMLWMDSAVQVAAMSLKGAFKRMLAGMPIVMTQAQGPGRVAVMSAFEPVEHESDPITGCSPATERRW